MSSGNMRLDDIMMRSRDLKVEGGHNKNSVAASLG